MTKRILLRSFAIASVFSVTVLLLLAAAELTGLSSLGGYLFAFAVVAYGFTSNLFALDGGASRLPVVVSWLLLTPAMVAFYWPLAALALMLASGRRGSAATATTA